VRIRSALLLLPLGGLLAASSFGGYHIVKTIPVPGDGSKDYLTVDEGARRLYVSHGTQVNVIDLDTEQVVGAVRDLEGVHGIAVAPKLGRGFITNGLRGTITIFDLKTLEHLGEVQGGSTPDGIVYDAFTNQVFVLNKHSDSITVFGAADGKVAATIQLRGDPESPVTDGKGNMWTNLEHWSTMVRVDAQKLAVTARTPAGPCQGPSAQTIDREHRRLFIGCANELMAAVEADTGKIIKTLPIGPDVDALAFDPATQLIFVATDGFVNIFHEDSPDSYSLVDNLKMPPGANTLALDPKTHKVYLSTADFGSPPPPTPVNPHPGPEMLPGTFKVIVLGQ
jgi:DNA-binding beta-propeller fold protein YncE